MSAISWRRTGGSCFANSWTARPRSASICASSLANWFASLGGFGSAMHSYGAELNSIHGIPRKKFPPDPPDPRVYRSSLSSAKCVRTSPDIIRRLRRAGRSRSPIVTPAARSRPMARQASPHSGLDRSRPCRSQSAASTISGQVGLGRRRRASTVVPAAPARPDAASAGSLAPPASGCAHDRASAVSARGIATTKHPWSGAERRSVASRVRGGRRLPMRPATSRPARPPSRRTTHVR